MAPPDPLHTTAVSCTEITVNLTDVKHTLRAARIEKNASLMLLVFSGALAAPGRPRWTAVLAAAVATLLGSMLVTQLNQLTDAAIDLGEKRRITADFLRNRKASWRVVQSELLGLVLALTAVWTLATWTTLVGVCAFLTFSTLYSYNFLSASPVERRWKAHWFTHALAFCGAYLSLWIAGFATRSVSEARAVVPWFLVASASDYLVYLVETGLDRHEESRARMQTLAALLPTGVLSGCAAAGLALLALVAFTATPRTPLIEAVMGAICVRLVSCVALVRMIATGRHRARASRTSDWIFHTSRGVTAAVLVALHRGSAP